MSRRRSLVSEYYDRIDRCDHGWIVDLFAPRAIYRRAGRNYAGRDAIARFFTQERRITGRHRIHELIENKTTAAVIALGAFEGRGEAGDPRAVEFADIWKFDGQCRVELRLTYLALGHNYVER